MTNTSTRATALGLTLALGAALPGHAQTPAARPASAIVVVDVDRVFAESASGKSLLATLRPQAERLKTRQTTLQEQFAKEEQALQQAAQAKTLTPDVLETRARDVRQREQTAQTELAGGQRSIQTSSQSGQQQILDAMNPIVTAIMRERGASVALQRGATLQMAAGLDITPDIISRLDRALPRVNLTTTATAPSAAPRR